MHGNDAQQDSPSSPIGRLHPAWASPGLAWLVLLLLAILAGSSGLALDFGEKSAPLYWVELWALLAYPLYLVAVKGGRIPAMRTFYVLAAVGLLWEALAIPRSSDPLRGARVIPFHMAGLAVYCFAVSLRLSRPRAAVAVRVLMLSSLLLLAFSATSFLAAGGLEGAASARAIESAVGRSNALATLFGMVGVLSLGLWAYAPEFRVEATIGLVSAAFGLALTGSRGGLAATSVGLL